MVVEQCQMPTEKIENLDSLRTIHAATDIHTEESAG